MEVRTMNYDLDGLWLGWWVDNYYDHGVDIWENVLRFRAWWEDTMEVAA
jgi:hypothetical protein